MILPARITLKRQNARLSSIIILQLSFLPIRLYLLLTR